MFLICNPFQTFSREESRKMLKFLSVAQQNTLQNFQTVTLLQDGLPLEDWVV